jgi:hypothetical protein
MSPNQQYLAALDLPEGIRIWNAGVDGPDPAVLSPAVGAEP